MHKRGGVLNIRLTYVVLMCILNGQTLVSCISIELSLLQHSQPDPCDNRSHQKKSSRTHLKCCSGLKTTSAHILSWYVSVKPFYPGLGKFNICVHWFSCMQNGSVHTFVHTKLCVHKTVTVEANLHSLIYNILIAIVFPTYFAIN